MHAPVPSGDTADHPSAQAFRPLLELAGVSKAFAGVRVLHAVDLALYAGEVHAVLGENGAGKSTLVRILSGIIAEFEGAILLNGVETRFGSVREAQHAGISIIHQELNLVPEMTVAENIFLGREPRIGGVLVDQRALARAARQVIDRLGVALDPGRRVASLRVGERQLVEIAKALSLQARILVMDEPTSALSSPECERLFQVIRQLAAAGVAVVYISHRMEEIARLADRVTVLRDGRRIASGQARAFSPASLIAHMVGRDVVLAPPARSPARAKVLLAVEGLGLRMPSRHQGRRDVIRDISFAVHEGEVLGIGGLLGAGRSEVLETIFGSATGERHGRISVGGRPVNIGGPRDAVRHGIALITEDRKATGLLLRSSIKENLILPSLPDMALLGLRQPARETALAKASVQRLGVRCRSFLQEVGQLSGGNQQKVVLGKWLATNPRILLLDEPTRGIDVGAKEEIYDLVFRLAEAGLAIVVVTSELPELLLLSDRIMVLSEGRQAGILARHEATQEAVMTLASPRGPASLQGTTTPPVLPQADAAAP
jgi:ribose transport system ATP-binding protein